MLIITRLREQAKNKQTQSDLNAILQRWNWGGKNPQSSQEFLNKMAPWISERMKEQEEVEKLLKKKGVKSLSEL